MKKKRKKYWFCILSAVGLCFSLLRLPGFFGDLRRRKRPPLTPPPEEVEEEDAML
jgi:hypothetical protein